HQARAARLGTEPGPAGAPRPDLSGRARAQRANQHPRLGGRRHRAPRQLDLHLREGADVHRPSRAPASHAEPAAAQGDGPGRRGDGTGRRRRDPGPRRHVRGTGQPQGAADDSHALLQRLYAQPVPQPRQGAVGRGVQRNAVAAAVQDDAADQPQGRRAAGTLNRKHAHARRHRGRRPGLLLSHLLRRDGIDSVIVENRSRRYVVQRVRAGLLEQGTVDLMTELGLADRLHRKGLVHEGLALRFSGQSHRVPLTELTGKVVTIYGQNEVMKDLIDARLAAGGEILFEAEAKALEGLDSKTPRVCFRHNGTDDELPADFIAGCDGFHGMCRPAVPAEALKIYDREYPFAWLGILSESPPISHELIYVHHARGFALFTMRSPVLSRLYLQCTPDEDIASWPDARVWEELHLRLGDEGEKLAEGKVTQKAITPMRSFVA